MLVIDCRVFSGSGFMGGDIFLILFQENTWLHLSPGLIPIILIVRRDR